jgi:hypothetical protein
VVVTVLPPGLVPLRKIFVISVRALHNGVAPSGLFPVAMALAWTSSGFRRCASSWFLLQVLVAKLLVMVVISFAFWIFW